MKQHAHTESSTRLDKRPLRRPVMIQPQPGSDSPSFSASASTKIYPDHGNLMLRRPFCSLLGVDSLVIAGTGTGKTMPFMMPLMLDPKKKALIISPLKILQADQASRFEKAKVSAVAVNGESWSTHLLQELKENRYQGIFASPEMCLRHEEFRKHLTDTKFEGLCAVIVSARGDMVI